MMNVDVVGYKVNEGIHIHAHENKSCWRMRMSENRMLNADMSDDQ